MSEETVGNAEGGAAAEADTSGVAPEVLAEAQEQGWSPLEQWHGDPKDWIDAETFVRRGKEINPILRKALKKERDRTAALEAELHRTGSTVAELREYLAKVEERATANAIAQLKRARKDALASGDHDSAAEYDDQIEQIKAAPSAVPKKVDQPTQSDLSQHPEVVSWMAQNSWYSEENEDLVAYANGAAQNIARRWQSQGVAFTPATVLKEVTERTKKAFPGHFNRSPGASSAGMFESGGSPSGSTRTTSSSRKSNFATLPEEAKSQFKRFYDAGYYVDAKTGKPLSPEAAQEEYFKNY